MSNAAKLLARMRRNPRDWRIADLQVIANSLGVAFDHLGSSHVVFRHPLSGRLSVPAHRPIKPVYVRMFVDFIEKLRKPDED